MMLYLIMNASPRFIPLGLMVILSGCTSKQVKRSSYDALYQRQCIERTGQPNCDPEHPSYEEYRRQRADIPE